MIEGSDASRFFQNRSLSTVWSALPIFSSLRAEGMPRNQRDT